MKIPEKILVIRLSSIGDILLTFPLLSLVKRHYPDISIDYLINHEFSDILKPVENLLNEIIIYDKDTGIRGILKLRRELIRENYPLILDLHNNQRSHLLTFNLKSEVRRMKKYRLSRFLYVKFRFQGYPEINVTSKYLQTFPLPLPETGFEKPDYTPDKRTLDSIIERVGLADLSGKKILIYPGARHFTKRWPPDYFKMLIERIIRETENSVILAGSNNDLEFTRPLAEISHERIRDATGKLQLHENFPLVYWSDLVISNDSAPMHIADLLNKPLIAIFGNTVKRFGFYPDSPGSIIVEDNSVSCRPCSHIGFEKCPQEHFDCMRKITPEKIFNLLLELLNSL